jgi:conjugative relaxase-like TrwC/TraI family protein
MAKIYGGRTYLDEHLTANDYYCEGEKVEGRWYGNAAAVFGLEHQPVGKGNAAFENFRLGLIPDGQPLTQRRRTGMPRKNAAASDRLACFDFQGSAQKSVSIMAVALDDQRLRDAHHAAVKVAFKELESFAAYRAGESRLAAKTGNLCAGAFHHDASRSLDPQLHTHLVVANFTVGPDGKRYALDTSLMCKAIRYAGKVYQNELAKRVMAAGYEIREKINDKGIIEGFEIAGVSDAICERYSKRREDIERAIEKFKKKTGREPTAAEIHVLSRNSRTPKMKEITTPEVRALQLSQLSETERSELEALKDGVQPVRTAAAREENQVLATAVEHLFERASVAQGHAVMAEALNQGLGKIDLDELKHRLADTTNNNLECLNYGDLTNINFATKEGLMSEKQAVRFVNMTRGKLMTFGDKDFVMDLPLDKKLSPDQEAAVRGILGSRDQVVSFRGVAGAGKTTTLRQLDKGLAAAGKEMIYLAPTNAAKDVLITEGFKNAFTVSKFLMAAQSKSVKKGSVLVVDESGLNSNKQGAALLRLAEKYNARVVFVGDVRQHVSVEAGDFLRILETHSKISKFELTKIFRQTHAEYNAAEKQMADGNVLGGFAALEKLEWVHEGKANYIKAAAAEFLKISDNGKELSRFEKGEWKEKVILVAPTHAESHLLTDEIRAGMKSAGVLAAGRMYTVGESLNQTVQQKSAVKNYRTGQLVTFTQKMLGFKKSRTYEIMSIDTDKKRLRLRDHDGQEQELRLSATAAQKIDVARRREIEVATGDRILIRANDHAAALVNGNVFTVSEIMRDGTIKTREGKTVPADFQAFSHGYVVTSHKSQGRTCDHVVVAAAKLDGKAAYVSTSRGRLSCSVHTPNIEELRKGLPGTSDRTAALDVLTRQEAPLIRNRPGFWIKAGYEIMKRKQFRVYKVRKIINTALRLRQHRQHQLRVKTQQGIKLWH